MTSICLLPVLNHVDDECDSSAFKLIVVTQKSIRGLVDRGINGYFLGQVVHLDASNAFKSLAERFRVKYFTQFLNLWQFGALQVVTLFKLIQVIDAIFELQLAENFRF